MTRHSLTNEQWERIKHFFPAYRMGRPAKDHRMMVDAIIWILKTGAPWRDLPEEVFGSWKSVYTRFRRWRESGLWERIFTYLTQEKDEESIMIDSSIIRAHQHAAGAKKGEAIKPLDGLAVA
jgi:transposase